MVLVRHVPGWALVRSNTCSQRQGRSGGCERYHGDHWQGLQVFAADGGLLRTPDTEELREHVGSGNTSTERQTPFPMRRLVALMNVRLRVLLDSQLSPYRRSEIRVTETFLQKIPDGSVTLFDKGSGALICCGLSPAMALRATG